MKVENSNYIYIRHLSLRVKLLVLALALVKNVDLMAEAAVVLPQKMIPLVEQFPRHPTPYSYVNWKQRAVDYDSFIYSWENKDSLSPDGLKDGIHFSTILEDDSKLHVDFDVHKMPSYYGDQRIEYDGLQEAINQIPSVVGASLVGINKSEQDGNNYVNNLLMYKKTGSDFCVIRNQPTRLHFDWWYQTLPNVLFFMLADLYPNEVDVQTPLQCIADEYHDMVQDLREMPGGLNFFHQAFDPNVDRAVNIDHVVPEAGIMIGLVQYWAYQRFGKSEYLDAAKLSMSYFDSLLANPYYEIGVMWGPYLAARMNAEQGTNYDIDRYFEWAIDGSDVRPGWGTMMENWSGYDVYGVQGSRTDGGGYGFLMNTFSTAFFAPAVKYDYRYAKLVGKWLLNTSNAARFFYPDQMPADKQFHGELYRGAPEKAIGYEGLRASEDLSYSKHWSTGTVHEPNATGDPSKYGMNWKLSPLTTNLALYGSSWAGFFGAVIKETNVTEVLQIDLNALDFFGTNALPTYLYYNPHNRPKTINISLTSPSDLYSVIEDTYLMKDISGKASFTIPADDVVVLVVAPTGSKKTTIGKSTYIQNVLVRYQAGEQKANNGFRGLVAN